MTQSYTPRQIADGLLAGEFTRDSAFVPLAEVERMREVIRTIRARCVELDDSDAVSATLDITSAVLDSKP